MADQLRGFKSDDLDSFKIDSAGQLYWNGKKVRLGGWSLTEKITIIGILVAAIVTGAAGYQDLKTLWADLTKEHTARQPRLLRRGRKVCFRRLTEPMHR